MSKNLEQIISESVENRLNEMKLKSVIKSMIREYIESEFGGDELEEADSDKKETKKSKKSDNGKFNDYNEDDPDTKELVSSIEKYFKNPGIKQAPFAYKLFGVKATEGKDTDEMKNARSLFAKKVNNELNDAGYPYQFSPEEAVSLQSAISDHELNEVKKWMKVLE